MSDERLYFLRGLPPHVVENWILDAIYDLKPNSIGISASSLVLGMEPLFSKTTPLEMWDLCCAVVRERIAAKLTS